MAEGKYDHLKTTNITRETIYPPYINMIFHALDDISFQIRFTHVSVPFEMKEDPHSHDFEEVFVFVPCTEDLDAYDAESWIYMGENMEDKIVIKETCSIRIPAGVTHCPIHHKRVGTPFFFVNCPITKGYSAIMDGKEVEYPVDHTILSEEDYRRNFFDKTKQ